MRFLIGFLLALFAIAAPLRAQDQPTHMRPELPLIFPLTTTGKNNTDVTVKYPVMINPTTVLKPGMQLRVIYVLETNPDGSSDLAVAHEGTLEQSYARNAFGGGQSSDKINPNLAHQIEGYRRTVWQVPNNFVLAMAQYPTYQMHLIFSPTNRDDNLQDERFFFLDGLFVGLPDGKLRVVAVEKHSHSEEAGLKAGDEIIAVGGIPTHDDPMAYASAYATAKKSATDNEADSYAMTIIPAGKSEPQTIAVPMPPRIKSGLLSGFLDSDDSAKDNSPTNGKK